MANLCYRKQCNILASLCNVADVFSDLNRFWIFWTEVSSIKFHKNPSTGSPADTSPRRDRRKDTKLIGAFRDYSNSYKNSNRYRWCTGRDKNQVTGNTSQTDVFVLNETESTVSSRHFTKSKVKRCLLTQCMNVMYTHSFLTYYSHMLQVQPQCSMLIFNKLSDFIDFFVIKINVQV